MRATHAIFLLIAGATCFAQAPTSQPTTAIFYIGRANHETWGVIDPDKQILLSAIIGGLQSRVADLDGMRDNRARLSAILPKATTVGSRCLGEAALARLEMALGNTSEYQKHIETAEHLAAECDAGERPIALMALMSGQVKGKRYEQARKSARDLKTASAASMDQIAWVFGDNGAGIELLPVLREWSAQMDKNKTVQLMIKAGAIDAAEETARTIDSPIAQAEALERCAAARYTDPNRNAYAADIAAVVTHIASQRPSARAMAWARLARIQAEAGDKSGAAESAGKTRGLSKGFDPILTISEIARAQHLAQDHDGWTATIAEAEHAAAAMTGEELADAWYRIGLLRAEADDLTGAEAAVTEAEKAGGESVVYRADCIAAIAAASVRSGKTDLADLPYRLKDSAGRDTVHHATAMALAELGKFQDAWGALAGITNPDLRRKTFMKVLSESARNSPVEGVDTVVRDFGGPGPGDRASLYLNIARGVLGLGE